MLLHQPFCDRYGAYRALEEAYKEGKLRAIGVSNFYPDHFIDLASNMEIVPAVNQVEAHVYYPREPLRRALVENGTDRILGAMLLAAESHEVINIVKLAMDMGAPASTLRDMMFTHPTMAEALNDLFV